MELPEKGDMKTNAEMLHAMWLDQYDKFARAYLEKKGGPGVEKAIVFGYGPGSEKTISLDEMLEYGVDEEDFYKAVATIDLPAGSSDLILEMAKFSQADLIPAHGVSVREDRVFHLESLIVAAYPKHIDTGQFKGSCGGMVLDGELPDDSPFEPHVAFAGLGVILMRGCRQSVSPLGSDEEVCRMTRELWLGAAE
jgi:hypothetical protein